LGPSSRVSEESAKQRRIHVKHAQQLSLRARRRAQARRRGALYPMSHHFKQPRTCHRRSPQSISGTQCLGRHLRSLRQRRTKNQRQLNGNYWRSRFAQMVTMRSNCPSPAAFATSACGLYLGPTMGRRQRTAGSICSVQQVESDRASLLNVTSECGCANFDATESQCCFLRVDIS
jgi:hypothetical protein